MTQSEEILTCDDKRVSKFALMSETKDGLIFELRILAEEPKIKLTILKTIRTIIDDLIAQEKKGGKA